MPVCLTIDWAGGMPILFAFFFFALACGIIHFGMMMMMSDDDSVSLYKYYLL